MMKNILIIITLGVLMFVSTSVEGVGNKTVDEPKFTKGGFPIILDADKWPSQIIYDTVGACYQGTIRWVVLSHPSLIGQIPTLSAQRQMMEHCFCVMDKIRKENKVGEYIKKVTDPEWGGNLFMMKAMECVNEYKTLPSFFSKIIETPSDNETNNPTVVPDGETEDSTEESPDQQQEESNGIPETIFQG